MYGGPSLLVLPRIHLSPMRQVFASFTAVMTPRVVTLWYRAPEVLMGADVYDEAIDMQVECVGACVCGKMQT